jgi:hypothetical protein
MLLSIVVIAVLAACGQAGSSDGSGGGPTGASQGEGRFPMPANVRNLTSQGEDAVNFATSLGLDESVAFYRDAFVAAGLTERTILTEITDSTFNLVFDGDPSGDALVVQGVDLGDGTTNINIRFEDLSPGSSPP